MNLAGGPAAASVNQDGIGGNAGIGFVRGMVLDTNTLELYFSGK